MKSRIAILFAVVWALVTASPAFAVPAKPVDATAVTLLPADGTPESLRKMAASFSAAIARANKDANAKRSQLRQHLVEGFDRAVMQAQTAGDLDMVLAIKDAKDRFDALDGSEIPLVKNAIAFREKKTAEIEAARIADALKAAKDFNDELEKAKKAETQKGKIEAAKAFSDHQKKVLEWVKSLQAGVPRNNSVPVKTGTAPHANNLLPWLSVRYYDIATSGYATWICSERETRNDFRSKRPTMQTTSEAFGVSLTSGYTGVHLQRQESRSIALAGLVPMDAGICRLHGQYGLAATERFAMLMTGKIRIEQGGSYDFAAVADDDIVLYIDGSRVLNSRWFAVPKGSKYLGAGEHTILIAVFEDQGEQGFTVQWKQPGTSSFVPIPQSVLFHDTNE